MNEVTIATIGLNFNPKEKLTVLPINLPKNAEFFSARVKDNNPTIWVTYAAPSENFKLDFSEISFVICSCKYTQIEFDGHIYLGNIDINDDSYAVFYKRKQ